MMLQNICKFIKLSNVDSIACSVTNSVCFSYKIRKFQQQKNSRILIGRKFVDLKASFEFDCLIYDKLYQYKMLSLKNVSYRLAVLRKRNINWKTRRNQIETFCSESIFQGRNIWIAPSAI